MALGGRRHGESHMGAVHVNIFHGVDMSAAGLVPNLKVAILFADAKPSSAHPFRGCDIEIPPSGKRTIAFLRNGMRREDVCNRGCKHYGQRRRKRPPPRFLHSESSIGPKDIPGKIKPRNSPVQKTKGSFGSGGIGAEIAN